MVLPMQSGAIKRSTQGLEVASIEHHEATDMEPKGILRARHDIEQDTEILTRYWHNKKDAWQYILSVNAVPVPIILAIPLTLQGWRPST